MSVSIIMISKRTLKVIFCMFKPDSNKSIPVRIPVAFKINNNIYLLLTIFFGLKFDEHSIYPHSKFYP